MCSAIKFLCHQPHNMESAFISNEIEEVKKTYQNSDPIQGLRIVSSTLEHVRVEISKSRIKTLTAIFRFSPDYPSASLLIELRSKTIDANLLSRLTAACEQSVKTKLGKPQVTSSIEFLNRFLEDHPLCCCADEISSIKKDILKMEQDDIKLKQKHSCIVLKLQEGPFYHRIQINVPENYPDSRVELDAVESNFPIAFQRYFRAQAEEVARRCVEPPLNKKKIKPNAAPFKPQPSLLPAVSFLAKQVHQVPNEKCSLCNRECFPTNPTDVVNDEQHEQHIERVYCDHLYHLKCLVDYMKTPPFTGGKKCLTCGQQIFHDKYKISPRLSESRWAHQEARQRELDEVAEFLS